MGRKQTRDLPVLRSRSLSPNLPYLYPDSLNENLENKYRKGWYRVEYGGSKDPELVYLPRFSDRLKYLKHHVDSKVEYPRASSVPPVSTTVKTISKPRATTSTYYYTRPLPSHYYTRPLPSHYYKSLYYPYRDYSLDTYRYPYLSSLYSYPYTYYPYSSSLDTQLVLARADRALKRSSYLPNYYKDYYYRSLPYYYHDYDYYFPSLRTSDEINYRYRPRLYDLDVPRARSVPRFTSYSYTLPDPVTTTRTYYVY